MDLWRLLSLSTEIVVCLKVETERNRIEGSNRPILTVRHIVCVFPTFMQSIDWQPATSFS